ncbi:MAG: hypothetical protein E7560_04055 [Ruminococcaceae bacterium]|nr:hypothetical protein [Oscillospiraceae bacterium]
MKKIMATIISTVVLIFCFSTVCYAFSPSVYFDCCVATKKLPENTAYIDILFPIKETDQDYTDYSLSNGQKHGISKNSEIVKYNKDGYVSYTFHNQNSESIIKPFYKIDFICDNEFYNNNTTLFDGLNEFDMGNPIKKQYMFTVPMNSALEEKVDNLFMFAQMDISTEKEDVYVEFSMKENLNKNRINDFSDLREKYKTAKLAYIDQNGNVLSVSNSAEIYSNKEKLWGSTYVEMKLNGDNLDVSLNYGPPIFLGVLGLMVFTIVFFLAIIIAIIFILKMSKTKRVD